MAMPSIHSCSQLTDLNEKLISRLKKLKKRNDALEKELSSINERLKIENLLREHCMIRHVGVQTEPHPRGSWRVIKQPPPQTKAKEDDSHKTIESLMKNHKSLMRRYEREVRANTKHIETVASLNLRIQELEKLLSSSNERVRLLENQTQRHTPQGWSTPTDHAHNRSRTTPGHSGRRRRSRSRQSYSPQNYSQELETIRRERDRLKRDKQKLKKELGSLDENFFEEIEDLKFALQQSARLNQEYDKALKQVCDTYGAPFPLDSLPSRPKKSSSASKRPLSNRQMR